MLILALGLLVAGAILSVRRPGDPFGPIGVLVAAGILVVEWRDRDRERTK